MDAIKGFQPNVWDRMDNLIDKRVGQLSGFVKKMETKGANLDEATRTEMNEARANWNEAKKDAAAVAGALLVAGDAFVVSVDRGARALGNRAAGAGQTVGGGAAWAAESIAGGFKETVMRGLNNLASKLMDMGRALQEKILHHLHIAHAEPIRPDTFDDRVAIIRKAINMGFTDHSLSNELFLKADGSFALADQRGAEGTKAFGVALLGLALAGEFGVGTFANTVGALGDLSHACLLQADAMGAKIAELGARAARAGYYAAKVVPEAGRKAEYNVGMAMADALKASAEASQTLSEHLAGKTAIDKAKLALLEQRVISLETMVQKAAA